MSSSLAAGETLAPVDEEPPNSVPPNSDHLWKTETMQCVSDTLNQLEPSALVKTREITIDTDSPGTDHVTSVTLRITPSPIPSAVEVSVTHIDSAPLPPPSTDDRESGGSGGGDKVEELLPLSSLKAHASSPAASPAARNDDLHEHEHENGTDTTANTDNTAPASPPLHPQRQSHDDIPHLVPSHKKSSSHHFLYRWFHPADHAAAHAAVASGSANGAVSHSGSVVSSGQLSSSPSFEDGLGDIGNSSSVESLSRGSKHTLIYRLFHPNTHHHADDDHQHASSTGPVRPATSPHTSSSRLPPSSSSSAADKSSQVLDSVHGHDHGDGQACVAIHPPRPTDPVASHQRNMLLQRLFQHSTGEDSPSTVAASHALGGSTRKLRPKRGSAPPSMDSIHHLLPDGLHPHPHSNLHPVVPSGVNNGAHSSASGTNETDSVGSSRSSVNSVESVSASGGGGGRRGSKGKHQKPIKMAVTASKSLDNLSTVSGDKIPSVTNSKGSSSGGNPFSKSRPPSQSLSRDRKNSAQSMFKGLLVPPKNKGVVPSAGPDPNVVVGVPVDSLHEKYGQAEKVIGKGAGGTVKLFHKLGHVGPDDSLYAVKEFRKRRKNESEREYIKKLTSEFCISSNLHHRNVVETIDLVQDEHRRWCEIMEYCPGGDLYEILRHGRMTSLEINCCFKQLIVGMEYLHSMGVAHRDLKPENLLIDAAGHLKITDFGVSDVFRTCWEKEPHRSKGVCGSEPYIAPEEFTGNPYDARKVDIWSAGIIFYAMLFHGVPWRAATLKDPNYAYYLDHRGHFDPFMRLQPPLAQLLERILEPDPQQRISLVEI
eukprot:Partr_v1_DN28368_c0_g1_i1_m78590 putative serine threonine protein kinase